MRDSRTVGAGVLLVASLLWCGLWLAGPSAWADPPAAPAASPAKPDDSHPAARFDFRQVVQRGKDKVFPAVVYIKVLRETHHSGEKSTQEVSGSGVIISADGEVLTNWHVVDKATEVRCLLFDGQGLRAKLLGTDKDTDLGLLKLELPPNAKPLPVARIGDSTKLKEGDFVMAMGAPWGLTRSVSIGIISCTKRYLPTNGEYSLWLQTDASISPGNSGGPLVNTEGEVIGINTLGTQAGGDIGFSVPSETVQCVIPQIRQFGKVNWSWLGLQLQPVRDFHRNIYFEGDQGVIVSETDPESPARRCGIQGRDRILKVNGEAVRGLTEEDLPPLRRQLGMLAKNTPCKIELLRDGKPMTLELTPREKGKVEGEELDCPRWDFTCKAINQFDNPDLYFHRNKGVFIYATKYPGNAGAAGLAAMDILLKIDGKDVATLQDVKAAHKAALDNIATRHRVVVTILRNGLMRQVVMDFSRDHQKE